MACGKDFIIIEKQNKRLCTHYQNKKSIRKKCPFLSFPSLSQNLFTPKRAQKPLPLTGKIFP